MEDKIESGDYIAIKISLESFPLEVIKNNTLDCFDFEELVDIFYPYLSAITKHDIVEELSGLLKLDKNDLISKFHIMRDDIRNFYKRYDEEIETYGIIRAKRTLIFLCYILEILPFRFSIISNWNNNPSYYRINFKLYTSGEPYAPHAWESIMHRCLFTLHAKHKNNQKSIQVII